MPHRIGSTPNSPIRLDFSAQGTVLLQAGYEDDIASQQLAATFADADDLAVPFNPAYLPVLFEVTVPLNDVSFDVTAALSGRAGTAR